MHRFRTHTCGELSKKQLSERVKISGWVRTKRDHGNLLFVDLRDHHGRTQVVAETSAAVFPILEKIRTESVISVVGKVIARDESNVNPALPTGEIEVSAEQVEILSEADVLPIQVTGDLNEPEEMRLKNRFLDLRRDRLHHSVKLRSDIIASLRRRMTDQGFLEVQTPILTASSPEGARDYIVPSRVHPGCFYALPQAPQQFKQLLMVAGFDRYFQIAPCFRDEDARADRSPGEFYQLDIEMAFIEQDDVFRALEPVMYGVFKEFSEWQVSEPPFPKIPYKEAMVRYGTDKPDLRNPLEIIDVSQVFEGSGFKTFAKAVAGGGVVRALRAPGAASRARNWFDKLGKYAQKELGASGLAYILLGDTVTGPIAKFLAPEELGRLCDVTRAEKGDAVFFVCDKPAQAAKISGSLRNRLGSELEVVEKNAYRFCWIVDYPMYERDETTGEIVFSHNPFSMPQGGLQALNEKDPLDVLAYQYDIVCNGTELSSGAIRNHRPDIMVRAFQIAGYEAGEVEDRFGGLFRAFRYGAPPHGGIAPGVDRIVMLIADEPNIREVIAFPMAQNAQDLLMNAPAPVTDRQLKDVHIRVVMPEEEKKPQK